jgi:hypothetical protein
LVFLRGNQGSNKNVTDDSLQDVLDVLRVQKIAAVNPGFGSARAKDYPAQPPFCGQPAFQGVHLTRYEGLSMSGNEEAKRDAEEQVSKELANQPKEDGGPAKEESRNRRADAEEKLTKK